MSTEILLALLLIAFAIFASSYFAAYQKFRYYYDIIDEDNVSDYAEPLSLIIIESFYTTFYFCGTCGLILVFYVGSKLTVYLSSFLGG